MPVDAATARDVVARSSLFANVPTALADEALARLELLDFAPGETVLVEGRRRTDERDWDLFILIEGRLLATRAIPGGRTQQLSTIGPGEFFGELALADEGTRSATVTAVTPAVVGRLPGPVADLL